MNRLPDDIELHVYLGKGGAITIDSQFDREHPGLMDELQPYIEDHIFIDDGDAEEIDWDAVETEWAGSRS